MRLLSPLATQTKWGILCALLLLLLVINYQCRYRSFGDSVGCSIVAEIIFRRKTVPDCLNERPDDDIDVWVASNGNTTGTTMVDFIKSIVIPYAQKKRKLLGLSEDARVLLIVDGAGSHKKPIFKTICSVNKIGTSDRKSEKTRNWGDHHGI